jgi:DNA invertase Pin-like site-specific DNA recombinase
VIACLFVAEQKLQVEMTSQIISTLAPMERNTICSETRRSLHTDRKNITELAEHFVESPCKMLE